MKSKGVSEVLGSLIIISVIVFIASFLYVLSYPMIVESEETIKYRKAYFDLLEIREKIENVRSGLESNGTYTLRISGTFFKFQNEPVLVLNGHSFILSSIKVSGKGWSLRYENGAIIEERGTFSKILHYPDVYYSPETDTLTLPVIKFTGNLSLAGSGYITLNLRLENVTKVSLSNCSVQLISSQSQKWKDFLTLIGVPSVNFFGGQISFNVKKVEMTVYEVGVK